MAHTTTKSAFNFGGARTGLRLTAAAALCSLTALAGCSTTYTVDDGRKVFETLLAQIRTYAEGDRVLRPAIVKSAALHDKDCSTQWELPFDAESSYSVRSDDEKVAWLRGMGIDEHLRIISTIPGSPFSLGDILTEVGGYSSSNGLKMHEKMKSLRDDGEPFDVKLSSGAVVKVTPLKVCRGRATFAPPGKYANGQAYHWLGTAHPQEVSLVHLSPDEAEWVVLWTQGLSEEASGRMKTYHYAVGGVKMMVGSVLTTATMGAGSVAGNAASAAGSAMASTFGRMALAETPGLIAQATAAAAANTASLHGQDWAASTAFDLADKWAFVRMSALGMDPRAAMGLQVKLTQAGAVHNGLLFDAPRLQQMETLVAALPPVDGSNKTAAKPDVPASGVEVGAPIANSVHAQPADTSFAAVAQPTSSK